MNSRPDPGDRPLHIDSLLVSRGRPHEPGAPVNPGIFPTSIYREGGAYTYGREGNPTWAALEDALGAAEAGEAVVFSSGIAAINGVLDLVPRGGTVVAPDHPYSGTAARLAELEAGGEVRVVRVPMPATDTLIDAAASADLVWLETPTNPLMELCDIQAVTQAAQAAGTLVAVDNTFATALAQRPLDLGAHFSVQSATKYIGGHSDLLLGTVCVRNEEHADALRRRRMLLGAVPGALESWLALRGLRTMALRVERSSASALELAARLSTHPAVAQVLYPGLPSHPQAELAARQMAHGGSVVSFRVAAGADAAQRVCESVTLINHMTSLGGVETTMERRARHPLEHPDVPQDLIRLSVGIEHVDDLWQDLAAALTECG
ncbi:MAG: cystathionine gamma-synthase [Actinobacteria bacterium]|nr:cystathionine gamma-synthase [Actinomycetota bacterium]